LCWSEILSKNSAKLWSFLKKNLDIWNPKFQQNSIVYYFFLVFQHLWHFFFNFTYPTLSKNYGIFCSVLFEGLEIWPTIFWKILKVVSKKNIDMWNTSFFKILRFTICFFYFFIIFNILFSISSICTCQKILEIFMFFYFMD